MYHAKYCFTEILCADFICRKNVKTQMQMYRLKKINISYTGKNLVSNPKELSISQAALTYICGQSCTVLWARKSVSSWKLRKNSVIGCKVTLRGNCAFLFLEKLYVYGIQCFLYTPLYKQCVMLSREKKGKQFVSFGISTNSMFFELQKTSINWKPFSGFYISIT